MAPVIRQREAVTAGQQQARGRAPGHPVEGGQDRLQGHPPVARLDRHARLVARLRRFEDTFQVVDDQQQRRGSLLAVVVAP